MITSHLMGGIGNQMFQISAAVALSMDMGVEYKFDFDVCYTPAQGNTSNKYRDNIFKNINNGHLNQGDFKRYTQPQFSYVKLPKVDNISLFGDFQSVKYFEHHHNEIFNLFDLGTERLKKCVEFQSEINPSVGEKITAVHVRRGDYLTKPNFHPVCTVEYYQKAMEEIGGGIFIFVSDDMKWCKENFKGDNIFYSPFTNELDDLSLINSCDNQIISNSSFSWWGAFLCNGEDNIIIAPSVWFGSQGPQDTQDIIIEDWIKI